MSQWWSLTQFISLLIHKTMLIKTKDIIENCSVINFEWSEINVFLLANGQFYIRNLMLNTNIQIILIKLSSVLSKLIHLIDLDLRCSTNKLTWAFGHINQSIKGIVKRAEPCKYDVLLVWRILWHNRITPSLKEWRFLCLIGNFPPWLLLTFTLAPP